MKRHYWIFDMDGTLTVAVHDFERIRRELGLPSGKPILEEIAKLSEDEALAAHEKLDRIEFELAGRATAQQGAAEVLRTLRERGAKIGILTRNTRKNAQRTLDVSGLGELFQDEDILGRESCEPKPSADGIHTLLTQWGGSHEQSVMIGDYLHDMMAGKNAGVATICLDNKQEYPWKEYSDYCIHSLRSILQLPIMP